MKTRKRIALCVCLCMLLSLAAPILAYANQGTPVISYNGIEVTPKIEPYENSLGIMASAEDLAKVFGIEYDFSSRAKYFHMISEEHGDIYLVHNATSFISGENEFNCAPNFYFENGIPMAEVGFFCEMFGAEYTVSGSEIIISEKTEDEEAGLEVLPITAEAAAGSAGKLTGTVTYSSGAPSGGLAIDILVAPYNGNAFSDAVKAATVNLKAGATSGTFSFYLKDVVDINSVLTYAVYYSIPSLGLTGYLDRYGKTVADDEEISGSSFSDSMRFDLYYNSNMAFDIFPLTTASGTISFDRDVLAPSAGLDVTIHLATYSDLRKTNYGYTYRDYGETVDLGTVNFSAGENKKNYSFKIPKPDYPDDYPNYLIYYSTTTRNCIYSPAYLTTSGSMQYKTYYSSCPSDAKLFNYKSNAKADIKLVTYANYGEVIRGKCGDNITWALDEDSGVLKINGRGEMHDYLYATQWDNYRSKIKSVIIGEGVTSIGRRAFAWMYNITSVSLPDSLRRIETEAFDSCKALGEIELPDGLTDIEYGAFDSCQALKTVRIPDSINSATIGTSIFYNCSNLETVYAPYKLHASESRWLGSYTNAEVIYDCNVVYKMNGHTVKAEEIEPGSVISVPDTPPVPSGGVYILTVNGKVHTGTTITVGGNTVIEQTVLSPSSAVKSVVECESFSEKSSSDTYNFSFNVESVSGANANGSTAIVALYDSVGRLVGIERTTVSASSVSGSVSGMDASSYKIMLIDGNSLRPSSFSCEGSLE